MSSLQKMFFVQLAGAPASKKAARKNTVEAANKIVNEGFKAKAGGGSLFPTTSPEVDALRSKWATLPWAVLSHATGMLTHTLLPGAVSSLNINCAYQILSSAYYTGTLNDDDYSAIVNILS